MFGVGRGLPRVTWVRFWIGNGVLDSVLSYPERNSLSRSRRVIRLFIIGGVVGV